MSVRTEQDNLHVNALVVDEDTLRYGGSLFLRSQDEPCSVVEAWDGKGGVQCSACATHEIREAFNYCPMCGRKKVGK